MHRISWLSHSQALPRFTVINVAVGSGNSKTQEEGRVDIKEDIITPAPDFAHINDRIPPTSRSRRNTGRKVSNFSQGLLRHQIEAPAVGSHSDGLSDLNFLSQSGKMIAWLAATCRRHPVITLTSI